MNLGQNYQHKFKKPFQNQILAFCSICYGVLFVKRRSQEYHN